MRPAPLAFWICLLAAVMQLSAAAFAFTHDGDRRGVVMGVSGAIFAGLTIFTWVRRPVRRD